MKGIKTAAELDSRLAEVLSVLHHAYDLFNEWERYARDMAEYGSVDSVRKGRKEGYKVSETDGQFYDENVETVVLLSDAFGDLESGLAGLIADKMLFDLEMGSKGLK